MFRYISYHNPCWLYDAILKQQGRGAFFAASVAGTIKVLQYSGWCNIAYILKEIFKDGVRYCAIEPYVFEVLCWLVNRKSCPFLRESVTYSQRRSSHVCFRPGNVSHAIPPARQALANHRMFFGRGLSPYSTHILHRTLYPFTTASCIDTMSIFIVNQVRIFLLDMHFPCCLPVFRR